MKSFFQNFIKIKQQYEDFKKFIRIGYFDVPAWGM